MSAISHNLHHSFDVLLAKELKSTDLAILIHNFQYWISHNATTGKNFHDGKTWSYISMIDIHGYFPYWSEDQVQRLLKKLVEMKILIKGNYNQSSYDRTVWYAFENEIKFSIPRNRGMDSAEKGNGFREIAEPIPYSKHIDKHIESPLTPLPEKPSVAVAPQKKSSSSFSPEAEKLANQVISTILEFKPDYAVPANRAALTKDLDLMLRVDKRSPDHIIRLLRWGLDDNFWSGNLLGSNVAKYLRFNNNFDKLDKKMNPPAFKDSKKVDRSAKNADGTRVSSPGDNLF